MKPYYEDNSSDDENSRISDVFDFSGHPISSETNDENPKYFSSPEICIENRLFFNDDSVIQSIKRGRKRSRK